ncbi:winged helix-turn-helix transcriptional regulator [Methanolobus mangrovi]|uniref:Winged helix-turn-helix transcriptional regulator n=1 Tax=Methanolobus mangrovi TaxID=3072977 RepID=A0AA51UGG4_9EURY|nr:winged helix-turn-helix transcriptional regulator [Methanolobus mangrovi]WMW22464.1 winged helix-turn-helix transcriptional regulator [Methanolobus mangrovi]
MPQQIILINLEKPREKKLEEDIRWFCNSFGLSSGRDTENIATQVVHDLLQQLSEREGKISSDTIAENLDVNLSRVNHHIRNLISSGLIYRQKRALYIRGGSLKAAVQEMRKDSERIFQELEEIAEEIDEQMGLKNR